MSSRRLAWCGRTALATVVLLAALTAANGAAPADSVATRQHACEPGPRTLRVSVASDGTEANRPSEASVLSGNGRFVAYLSSATNLVHGDVNGKRDIFVHDLHTRETAIIHAALSGLESNGRSDKPSISPDGRFVAFSSHATNLVPDDTNGVADVFLHDRVSGTTRRVSTGSAGEANGPSLGAYVSSDGATVLFSSKASNLVPGDRNGVLDVFVSDAGSGSIERVSVGRRGEANGVSESAAISADGHVVSFRSRATNLVPRDRNGFPDVFVRDRRTGITKRVSVSSAGKEADGPSFRGTLSANGRFVGFRSKARNLVPGDTNGALDVFVHDRVSHTTRRISVSSTGAQANARALPKHVRWSRFMTRPFFSANGRFAAFSSRAPNLVPGDRNKVADVFVRDLWTGTTTRVSTANDGAEGNGDSLVSGISADGRVVSFQSSATNLVPGDTNGHKDVFVRFLCH